MYGRRVRRIIDTLLDQAPEQIVHVAIEHRLMHAETFAYLLHNLPYQQKLRVTSGRRPAARALSTAMLEIPEGAATLGQKAYEFGWDNEFSEHQVRVAGFAIGKHKITNAQYLEFVRDGAPPPHFWTRRGDDWFYHGMFEEIPLPMNAPVHVTHREASSYARWAGKALPSEAQFHRAAYGTPAGDERHYPWGHDAPDASRGNFDFHHWDPLDVDATPAGDSAFGVSQLLGNGWEWTSTVFAPFPGFEPFPFYRGLFEELF